MQVKIDRRELLKMINVTLKAVSSKASFEELEGLKVSADTNGQITLQSTNPDMSISYSSSAEVIKGGEFVIKAKMFEEAVKRLYDGDVVLASDGDRSIRIESGKSRFKLTALSTENFPHSEDIENKFEFSIPQKTLRAIVQQTASFAANTEGKKPVLTGILLDIKNGVLTAVASDGLRLARIITDVKLKCNDARFIIPVTTMRELFKITEDSESDIEIVSDNRKIIFNYGKYIVSARLLDGEYLNYESIMNDKGNIKVIISKPDIMDLLERTLIIVNSSTDKKFSKLPVKLEIGDNKIKAVCASKIGKINDEISADTTGNITIGFNCDYLLDALKACKKSEVIISLSSPVSGAFIYDVEGVAYLVLPVRLHN